MTRHSIEVAQLEFDEGGTTIWVHSPLGATVLRIKCDRITLSAHCTNVVPHADVTAPGEIEFCMPERAIIDHKPAAPTSLHRFVGSESRRKHGTCEYCGLLASSSLHRVL